MKSLSDAKIVDSWSKNVDPWTTAVRSGDIESRRLVTNQAIIDAVRSRAPRTGIDIGCGEGWLVRALADIDMIGIDVIPGLIDAARKEGAGDFRVMSYEELANGKLKIAADVAICNFSLLGKESVEGLFRSVRSFLSPHGALIVQTLHPMVACGDGPYLDSWKEGTWAGFHAAFNDPPPWYFRTIETWVKLFEMGGLYLREMREPLHPTTGKPASVIFIGELRG